VRHDLWSAVLSASFELSLALAEDGLDQRVGSFGSSLLLDPLGTGLDDLTPINGKEVLTGSGSHKLASMFGFSGRA
jgi:hypothetical protein